MLQLALDGSLGFAARECVQDTFQIRGPFPGPETTRPAFTTSERTCQRGTIQRGSRQSLPYTFGSALGHLADLPRKLGTCERLEGLRNRRGISSPFSLFVFILYLVDRMDSSLLAVKARRNVSLRPSNRSLLSRFTRLPSGCAEADSGIFRQFWARLMFSRKSPAYKLTRWLSLATILGFGGCVLAPPGVVEEQAKLNDAGGPFEPPIEARELPPVPIRPSWRDVLHRAFLANGELESAYFNWKAALIQVDQAAAWPNSQVAISYSYMFSRENMKAWDRMTISAGFNPAVNLQLPVKVEAAGRVAFEAAREAGERFRAAKFDLQRRVLTAYLDLALALERVRIERDNVSLLKLLAESAKARATAGGPLQDLLKVQTDSELAQNSLRNVEAEARAARSVLNGLLAREANAPLDVPSLPPPRAVIRDDAKLIAVAVECNPELAALARQVASRRNAVDQALLAYLPDINPSFSVNGSISQTVAAMVMLPTTLPQIQAAIANAEAMVRSAQAVARQTEKDRAASFVAALYFMRNAERQTSFFHRRVTPLVEQLMNSSREAYAAGAVSFADLIDSKRTYITIRRLNAEARIEREKRLAELEAIAGVDVETLGRPALVIKDPPPVSASQ